VLRGPKGQNHCHGCGIQVWYGVRICKIKTKLYEYGVKKGKSQARSRHGVKIVKIKAVFFFVFFVFGQGCVPRECYGVLRVFCFFCCFGRCVFRGSVTGCYVFFFGMGVFRGSVTGCVCEPWALRQARAKMFSITPKNVGRK